MSRKSAEVGAEPGRRGSAARLIRRLSCVWCLAAVWQISAASAQTLIRADPITIEDADHVLRAQAAGQTAPIVPSVAPSALPGAVPSPPAAAAALAGAPAVGCAPASAQPVEIATLAAALKCDPDLIVEYVYNNIEYEPLFGSNKGALGTLLDQRGNDIDQAQLFTALLGAAGFSASQLNYQYGYIRINGVQASGWLGVKNDAFAIVQMLANGGIPLGSPFIYNDSNGTLVSLDLAHVWVQVQIGGTNYVFDPSFKQHTVSSGLANLGIILGYSQAQLLADAGGTIDSVSISNVNRAAIRNDLVTYAGNLIKYIKQNNPAWAVSDIIGGKSIQYLTGSPRRQTVLPYLSPSQPSGFPQNWGATVQNAYRTCIAITLPPVPPTPGTCQSPLSPTIVLFSDQTYGQRITVFSVPDPNVQGNFIPTLLVNGAAPASGTNTGPSTASGQFWSIYTAIAHPYTSGLASANEARSLTVRAGGSYLITAGWGQVGRGMVEKHRQLLAQALAVPNVDPASEAVLGESLAVIGYSWLAEHAAQLRIGDQLAQVTTQYHHGVGITGQSVIQASNHQGPFVDLPLNYYTIGQQTCWPSTSCPFLVPPVIQSFFSNLDVASALESAVLEQTQAPTPNMVAASTIKLIDINAGTGAKTFFADGTSAAGVTAYQTSIRPNLTGYSAQDLQNLNNAIFDPNTNAPTGKQAVIPARGNIQVGLWQGAGYTVIQQTSDTLSAAHLISGGLSGGFTGTDVPTSNLNDNTAQTVVAPPAAPDVPAVVNTQPAPSNPTVSDPVDAITGAYVYRRTDLVTGGGAFPYALPFGRVYRSSSNTSDIGMGNGWTHSYSLTASTTSDPYQALGGGSPISAAAAIAAIYVAQDLWSGSKNAQMMTVAAVVTRWLTDQLTNNAVLVSQPDTSEEFIALPQADNPNITIAYDPPLGSAAVLTRTGTTYGYTAKDGTRLTFVPAAAGAAASAISSWASPNGTSVTFGYDGTGKLATVANNLGRRLTLGYSGTHVSSVTDESGRAVTFGYDVANNLARATDPLGFVSSLFYDGASRLTQIFYPSNPGSAFVTNSYDGLGRISAQANANGNSSAFYMAGARTELIDAAGDRHVTYQTARGKVIVDAWVLDNGVGNIFNDTAQQNGVVNVARNQYDGQDRLVLATAPEGGSVGYVYSHDLRHNIIQVTQTPKPGSPLSPLLTSYSYDQLYNKPTAITDPRGLVTVMNYDAVTGNLLQLVADFGNAPHFNATSTFSYNNLGQVVTATDPLGSVTRYSYDSYGNRTSITRDAGSGRLNLLTQMSYSAAGDVTWLTDPNGKVTANTYDAARRLVTTTSPATPAAPNGVVTALSYDRDGRVIQTVQSASGTVLRSTSATYTLTGQRATATDANGNVMSYAYDVADRLASLTDAMGHLTSYAYDALGRRTKVFNTAIQATPLSQQGYTPNGLPASLTDASGNTTTFAYDGFDRPATTTYPAGGTTETFSYDADGNVLTRKTRANATITFAYDTLNRLVTKTPPAPAPVVSYSYDLAGRLTGVSDTSATITAAAPPAPNTQYATSYTYDSLNRPMVATWSPAPTQAATAASSATFAHSYNKTNQRTGQTATDNTWWFYPTNASAVAYTSNALNQYTAVGAVTPTYDGNGNLTNDGTFSYGYDAENRLASATGAGTTATYAYDGQGRRKLKTVNGATTIFVTDADNREVLEYDGSSGAVLRWYAYGLGPNDVFNQMNVAAATRATFVPDVQGSIIATLDSGTGTLSKRGYLPYGAGTAVTGTFAYTGQRIDPETSGLYYYRARMYSTTWGRFTQPDPIGYAGGSNLYAYVGNDPLNRMDPTGLWIGIDDAIATVAGALIGVTAQGIADLVTGRVSSWRSYVAAGVGGAAGGEAALYTGGLAAGAAGGAAYSVTNQLLSNGNISVSQLVVETGISAATAGLGSRLLPAAASLLPAGVKGQIGEAASVSYNWAQGSTLLRTQAEIPGLSTIADSSWQSLRGSLYYVESKFGTGTLTSAQREAQAVLGDAYHVERWTYDWVARGGANLGNAAGVGVSAATGK